MKTPAPETIPARPVTGVSAVVINQAEQVLLIKRGQPPSAGLWSIPGGKQEYGESLAQTCAREVLEETGIHVIPGEIVAVAERIDGVFHYVIVDFLAELDDHHNTESPACAASDALEARWIRWHDLSGYALAEGVMPVLEAAYAMQQGQLRGLERRQTASDSPADYLPYQAADQ